jgi:hypothetical protein
MREEKKYEEKACNALKKPLGERKREKEKSRKILRGKRERKRKLMLNCSKI